MSTEYELDGSVYAMKDFTPYPRYVLRSGMLTTTGTAGYLWFISHDAGFVIRKTALLRAFPKLGETKYRGLMAELAWFNLAQHSSSNGPGGRLVHRYLIRWPTPDEVAEWRPWVPKPRKPKLGHSCSSPRPTGLGLFGAAPPHVDFTRLVPPGIAQLAPGVCFPRVVKPRVDFPRVANRRP